MSGYLLDTNHLSIGVRRESSVAKRLEAMRRQGRRTGTCVPALSELEVGIQQVADPVGYRLTLRVLMRRLRVWPISVQTARIYGETFQDLKARGRVLSQVDLMLAALCRELDLVLVTTEKDFAALPWLKTENWT